MFNEQTRVIYEPSAYINDSRLLTTLCIYYDQVMLFHHERH